MNDPKPIAFEPHFGAFVLETLTIGMYGDSRNALREYVQNAFDATQSAIAQKLISPEEALATITLEQNNEVLIFRDNGTGLSSGNAVEILTSVGASMKKHSRDAGFRGIGRLAGITFANNLVFETRANGEKIATRVEIDAEKLRSFLQPGERQSLTAAEVMQECMLITQFTTLEGAPPHYFDVRMEGFTNPPHECKEESALFSFLQQVSPLPYANDFPFKEIIERYPLNAPPKPEKNDDKSPPLLPTSMRVKLNGRELAKPYSKSVAIKRVTSRLEEPQFVGAPRGSWWGWVSSKSKAGTISDETVRGIRVRVRNIQIDDTSVMREIFADVNSSYQRLSDWFVGEIFIRAEEIVPNARRDNFEETPNWLKIRTELKEKVAEPFGKKAYQLSKRNQLSPAALTKKLEKFSAKSELHIETGDSDGAQADVVGLNSLRQSLSSAIALADDEELAELDDIDVKLKEEKSKLTEYLYSQSRTHDCEEEIEQARTALVGDLLAEAERTLGPKDYAAFARIITGTSGIEPQ